ncbi:MAG: hypothetical protein LAT54_09845 [Cryomorphaceae bacterium]|nr:hypothetical protein [Cryomorphaceae bacterium]
MALKVLMIGVACVCDRLIKYTTSVTLIKTRICLNGSFCLVRKFGGLGVWEFGFTNAFNGHAALAWEHGVLRTLGALRAQGLRMHLMANTLFVTALGFYRNNGRMV